MERIPVSKQSVQTKRLTEKRWINGDAIVSAKMISPKDKKFYAIKHNMIIYITWMRKYVKPDGKSFMYPETKTLMSKSINVNFGVRRGRKWLIKKVNKTI